MRLIIEHEGEQQIGVIPSTFEDLSVKQFLALEAGGTDLQILSVLSGIDLTYIENTGVDLSPAMQKIYRLMNQKPPDLNKAKKQKIIIEGKEINFPKTLNFTRYGQKSMVKNLIQANDDKLELIVSEVFAIYAQPILDGNFDSSRIPAITEVVDNMKIIDVFPYAVFFLERLKRLKIVLSIS
jgi:hypothetical protein